ncbi:MAG: phage major capsid protein [Phycisphaeraceae bacterium]
MSVTKDIQQRAELARELRNLADRQGSWTAEDRAKWDRLNTEYDATHARAMVSANGGIRNRIGRDGGSLEDGPANRGAFSSDSRGADADRALAGWVRNASGVPVRQDEAEAAQRMNAHLGGNAFEVRLATCRPTPGNKLSFTPRNALSTDELASGGATVPEGFLPRLEVAMKATAPMLQVAEVMVTEDGRAMPWPTLDDVDNEGVQLGQAAESEEQDLSFGRRMLWSYKLSSKIVKASHELLRDSALDLSGEIGSALGQRLGRALNRKGTTGTGASEAVGIVEGSTTGVTASSATAIDFDELIRLQASIDPAYRDADNGWMMHSDVAAKVRQLKDGNGRYLWEDSQQAGQPPRLLGEPVYINQMMASTVESGAVSVLYGKLSMYKIRLVGAVRFRQLVERYAEFDVNGFISFLEHDAFLMKPSSTDALCPVRHIVH